MSDHTNQILHDLTKASMDIYAKMNIIPQRVLEMLKFKRYCNLIGGEHFGL